MTRFNRVTALWGAFYSRDLYRQVVHEWKGVGLLTLVLLLTLTWIPSAVRWSRGFAEFQGAETETVIRQLPVITIDGGVMSADPPGRHAITLYSDEKSAGMVAIIDDSLDTVPADIETEAVVLTRHEIAVIRPSRGERRVWTLTSELDMKVTPDDVRRVFKSLGVRLSLLGYVGAVMGSLVFRLLQAVAYGAGAIVYARRLGVTLPFAAAMRLAAVAVTPVVLIRTALWFGPWEPAWYVRWPFGLLITAGFIAFGIRSCAEARQGQPEDARAL
jgi:hypothetical protein